MAAQQPAAPSVPTLAAAECRQLLADALAAKLSREVGDRVTATASALDDATWLPFHSSRGPSSMWVAPLDITFEYSGARATAHINWPMPWDRAHGVMCETAVDAEPVRPGSHTGLYIGGPLAVGQGVRLRPGLHVIPRPSGSGDWQLDCVVASLLGRDVFGASGKESTWKNLSWAILGGLPARFVDSELRTSMLGLLGLDPDVRDRGLILNLLRLSATLPEHRKNREMQRFIEQDCHGITPAVVDPGSAPRRTSASRNRLFGADEVMAELAYSRMSRQQPRTSAEDDGVAVWLSEVAERVSRATDASLVALASGSAGVASIIRRPEEGMTLTRIEASARTCFLGFRGIGKIRGRADLRDLEPGWRGQLCPVQTPESKDTGLVRYAAVGTRNDAPPELDEWFDLSASAALIPFVNHDDPARASIGSKNLKQTVPVDRREPPLVYTGWERVLGTADGTARAPERGTIAAIEPGSITLDTRGGRTRVATGAPWLRRSQVDNEWFVDVAVGDRVRAGQILAHAPDVKVVDNGTTEAELSLGVNALVALTPWHGLNFEDAIVVSESLAERLGSTHIVRVDEPRAAEESVMWLSRPIGGEPVPVNAGEPLLVVTRANGRTDTISSPVAGELFEAFLDNAKGTVSLMIRVRRPLAVGDKLSNRHQGKGVVSAILPDDQMPRLPDNQLGGRRIEMILNPVGVLRRLNIGQLWEMHVGLESLLTDGDRRRVGRIVASPDALGRSLAQLGAPKGRLKLILPGGSPLGGDDGVVVGPQYIMKLNHLAASKLSVRDGTASTSPVTGQPSRGRRYRHNRWIGSAQHLGEMEVWALEAEGASEVLADMFAARSAPRDWAQGKPRASLRAVQAHLAVGGLALAVNDSIPRPLQDLAASDIRSLAPVWRHDDYPELPHWRELARWDGPARQLDLAALVAAFGETTDGFERLVYGGGDPLYRPDVHGYAGTPESEQVRYSIPLPRTMRHPWTTKKGPELPRMASVPVLPPAFRVATPLRRGLDRAYQDLAWLLVEYERIAQQGNEQSLQSLWNRIRERVRAILILDPDSVGARLSGKRGLLSRYLLGQSVLYSGRAVIVPDLDLEPDEVGLPAPLAKGLGLNGLDPDDDVVIINRQPSLHPYNLVALRARLTEGTAIRLHPLYLGGLAGDFDGDTVAVHRPFTHAARREAWEVLSPAARVRSSASGAVLAKLDLDISLGLYRASTGQCGTVPPVLGSAGTVLDTGQLPVAVEKMVSAMPDGEAAVRALDEVERAGFEAAVGWSIGALDLWEDGEGGHLAEAIAAGVAGGEKAVNQLLHARGKPNDHSGHPNSVVPNVAGCYLTGLSVDDYFDTSPVALAELAHKKLTTPRAGQLTKTLVAIADPVTISKARCDTDEQPRSPLTCSADQGVCQACYGADPGTGSPPRIGSRVGVLAATVIGERSTQEAMKAFQAGGGRGDALGSALDDLYAVFGLGRSRALDLTLAGQPRRRAKPLNLAEFLATRDGLHDRQRRGEALQPLVDLTLTRLGGKVADVHVKVLLKQLVDAYLVQHPAPTNDFSNHPTITLEPAGGTLGVIRPRPEQIDPQLAEFIDRVSELLTKWLPIVVPPTSGHGLRAVRLRSMRSQWGSCSRKTGKISVSLRLVDRDPRLLEYLIVHELAHLHGKGHGPRWQAVMNSCLPGWRSRANELRPGDLATFAQQRGRSAFETATSRGNLAVLTDTDEVGIGGFRTRLAAGGQL